jgi:hypothetical protein
MAELFQQCGEIIAGLNLENYKECSGRSFASKGLENLALRCFVWVVFLGKKAQNASLRSIKKPA